jgi:hypothetical protein
MIAYAVHDEKLTKRLSNAPFKQFYTVYRPGSDLNLIFRQKNGVFCLNL